MTVASEEGDTSRVIEARSEHNQEVINEQGLVVEVELEGLVVELDVGHLCDDVFELALLPRLRRVGHHREDSIVVLLVLVIEEDELRPEMGLLGCTKNLDVITAMHTVKGHFLGIASCASMHMVKGHFLGIASCASMHMVKVTS